MGTVTRLGVRGCGSIAYWAHLRVAKRLEGAQLVAAADPDPHLHAELAVAACAARKHVYLEKPIAASYAEGTRIVEAAARQRSGAAAHGPARARDRGGGVLLAANGEAPGCSPTPT
jgi:predicted dehydrogenase